MGQKSPKEKKSVTNSEFTVVTYLFVVLFLGMIGYFVYFQIFKSQDFINSPYNARQDLKAEYVVRGEIRAKNGEVLAKTEIDEDGNETRIYPYSNLFSHVVGYSTNGKSGLEAQENYTLLSSDEFFLEQISNNLKEEKNLGNNVVTTLDYDIQKVAYDALGNYQGAVIVMEPETGKIIAMVSKPDFDPNTVGVNWDQITQNGSTVLYNRATQGQYAPGSVFKIFTALEYYREDKYKVDSYLFQCNGSFTHQGKTIHCASNEKHGEINYEESFAESCNASFANLAIGLKPKQFTKTCEELLFNQDLPIAFENRTSKFSISDSSSASLIMETGIGQGETLVSPLHMLLVTSAICNDGVLMQPYLVDYVENASGTVVDINEPEKYKQLMTYQEAKVLQGLMGSVVSEGTASSLKGQKYQAYGKTGTAQVSDTTEQTNAWFVGYAKMSQKNDIAIAVIVENSGYGSKYAVPIAKKVFEAYYAK